VVRGPQFEKRWFRAITTSPSQDRCIQCTQTHTRFFHNAHIHVTVPLPTSSSSRVLHFANVFHTSYLHSCMLHSRPLLSTSVPGQVYMRSSVHTSVHSLVTFSLSQPNTPVSTLYQYQSITPTRHSTATQQHTITLL